VEFLFFEKLLEDFYATSWKVDELVRWWTTLAMSRLAVAFASDSRGTGAFFRWLLAD